MQFPHTNASREAREEVEKRAEAHKNIQPPCRNPSVVMIFQFRDCNLEKSANQPSAREIVLIIRSRSLNYCNLSIVPRRISLPLTGRGKYEFGDLKVTVDCSGSGVILQQRAQQKEIASIHTHRLAGCLNKCITFTGDQISILYIDRHTCIVSERCGC
jgi:hypothetical protein